MRGNIDKAVRFIDDQGYPHDDLVPDSVCVIYMYRFEIWESLLLVEEREKIVLVMG